ncbi:hypothetical protein BKH42_08650 [Helicobacter sp. 13S00482-2]|uniref:SPFH domain-containing protein n=1 Tax=Helicobacter sp. 13S00482-2 TaxID=1476200 RepID=UPI000BA768AC|nr:SPFH domain-containing protein [Helicobacter sp. 13S00482-2]PAF52932.1 hypothetical protein BKH42_08650 [Helicobacter sp. 13S00482-2]
MFIQVIVAFIVVGLVLAIAIPVSLRRVVPTNEVHIIQSSKKTTSYGKDTGNGNTYYEWYSWIPILGVTKIILPVSVFNISLSGYEAYDKGKVPFVVDIVAFFRIADSNVAAQRVNSFEELREQLVAIIQGSIRTILSSFEVEDIMHTRSTFGNSFTEEVQEQLKNWGVSTVKNLELMDIRDSKESTVIKNIMEKKKSLIEMQSRTEVAKNLKEAQIAEINAKQDVEIQDQEAKRSVGLKEVDVQKEINISAQKATQSLKEEERLTKEKEMSVLRVNNVEQANINREVNIVKAEEIKQTMVINAEGEKSKQILDAEALLESKKKEAEGIKVEGEAKAKAEELMQLAPINAQIELAKEIGGNENYQTYLVSIKQIESMQSIGIAQAKALEKADVKVIANASNGNVSNGIDKITDIFSSNGGTQLGAMLEGISQSGIGKSILEKFGKKVDTNNSSDNIKKR